MKHVTCVHVLTSHVARSGVSVASLNCAQNCVVKATISIGCQCVSNPMQTHISAMNAGINARLSPLLSLSCIQLLLMTQAMQCFAEGLQSLASKARVWGQVCVQTRCC